MKINAKPVITLVVVAAVAVGLWYGFHLSKAEADGRHKIFGNVDIRTSRLAFNESEIIADMLVDEGDPVTAGQKLATLRSDRLEAQLAEARARLAAQKEVVRRLENGSRPQEIERARAETEAAQVALDKAKLDFERVEKTVKTGASSRTDYDRIKAQLDRATAELDARKQTLALYVEGPRKEEIAQAQAELAALTSTVDLLEIRLRDTVLYAPADGVIETRFSEPGEMAGPSIPVFSLALTARKWIRAYLPEPELGKVRPGQDAHVFSDSWPGKTFEGTVGFISPVAEFTPKTVETEELRTKLVYETRIWVDDPENELRLGMPVTVEFVATGKQSSGADASK